MVRSSSCFLAALGASGALAAGVHHCNETATDWTCYTVTNEPGEPQTLGGLAAKLHVMPSKLADFNLLPDTPSVAVPVGTPLRVPRDACTARPGSWGCYTVSDEGWETLENIAQGPASLNRNGSALFDINSDVLYGTKEYELLPPGLQLRLPTPPCVPTLDTVCFVVGVKDLHQLKDVAANFNTTADAIVALNEDLLGDIYAENSTTLVDGMQLAVPRPNLAAPSPCAKGRDWDCYTVLAGDTLHAISQKLTAGPHYDAPEPRANEWLLCEVNGLADCDALEVGQTLAIPLRGAEADIGFTNECVEAPGRWYCVALPPLDMKPGEGVLVYNVLAHIAPWGWTGGYGDYELGDLLVSYNAELLPANKSVEAFFLPGQSLRIPYRECVPTVEHDCIAAGDARKQRYLDAAYFNPMTLQGYMGNGESGYALACNGVSDLVPEKCNEYSYVPVPRQTFFPNSCGSPARVNASEPPCSPKYTPGSPTAPYECPTCTLMPGKHFCYKVVFGDTLEAVGDHFGIPWETLCFYNDMTNCQCLFAEDTYLKIPVRLP